MSCLSVPYVPPIRVAEVIFIDYEEYDDGVFMLTEDWLNLNINIEELEREIAQLRIIIDGL